MGVNRGTIFITYLSIDDATVSNILPALSWREQHFSHVTAHIYRACVQIRTTRFWTPGCSYRGSCKHGSIFATATDTNRYSTLVHSAWFECLCSVRIWDPQLNCEASGDQTGNFASPGPAESTWSNNMVLASQVLAFCLFFPLHRYVQFDH